MTRKNTEGQTTMIDAFRARADELGSTRPTGRFRTHTSLEDGPAHERRVVAQAVARAKAGDHEAIRFLYMRYADNVYGYVRSIVHDHHEAEDIMQNVFGKLGKALDKYEPREVPFTAWILRVSRNAALDHLRTRRAIPSEEVRSSDQGYEQAGSDRSRSLKEALGQLPEEQREVLILRHIAGLSPSEIATVLDKTEGSVHGLHHRGRGTLQTALRDLGAAPITAISR